MNPTPATRQPVTSSPIVLPTSLPTKLAVIAPLITMGPVTYETLLADLNDSPIPYQLWLLAQISPTSESTDRAPADSEPGFPATALHPAHSDWAVTPSFSPVSGVDATSVAWPNTETPRVITVQYSGLEINQAVNWAIRQAHGDMILVLDHGLSGLLQLRQALDEIRREMQRNATIPSESVAVTASPTLSQSAAVSEAMLHSGDDHPLPGALSRRLVERLEQWGVAMQRQAVRSRQQRATQSHQPHQSHHSHHAVSAGLPQGEIAAQEALEPLSATINRIDDESSPLPKKLPKFITHFHEFI